MILRWCNCNIPFLEFKVIIKTHILCIFVLKTKWNYNVVIYFAANAMTKRLRQNDLIIIVNVIFYICSSKVNACNYVDEIVKKSSLKIQIDKWLFYGKTVVLDWALVIHVIMTLQLGNYANAFNLKIMRARIKKSKYHVMATR